MKNIIYLFFLGMLCFDCRKDCPLAGATYEFVIPATLIPAKDTFNIGDTITISSVFSDIVYERITDKDYELKDFKFYPEASVLRIDTINQIDNFSEFDVVVDNEYNYYFFNYSDGGRTLVGQYNYSLVNETYRLEYKIIPRQEGLYLFSHASSIYGLGENQKFDGRCPHHAADATVEMNNRADNNVDFLLDSPIESMQLIWERKDRKFFDAGGYCFYVR